MTSVIRDKLELCSNGWMRLVKRKVMGGERKSLVIWILWERVLKATELPAWDEEERLVAALVGILTVMVARKRCTDISKTEFNHCTGVYAKSKFGHQGSGSEFQDPDGTQIH